MGGLLPGVDEGRTQGQLWGEEKSRGEYHCGSERQNLWNLSQGGAQALLPPASLGIGFRTLQQN